MLTGTGFLTGCAKTSEPGVPLESIATPHVRPGLWVVSEVLNGNPVADRRACIGNMKIDVPHRPDCDPYVGRFVAPNSYRLSGACPDGPLTKMNESLTVTGDLQHAFVAVRAMTEEGFHNHQFSTTKAYRFVGACPAGIAVESCSF
jgi:hypothetical protein